MDGKWTYSHSLFVEWIHETFDTKEKTIKEAKAFLGSKFLIGKLSRLRDGVNYTVTSIEEINTQYETMTH